MSYFQISGLNAIVFQLTDQFVDVWELKNNKRTPARRLQELTFSRFKREKKTNAQGQLTGYYTIYCEPETEEYKAKKILLEQEVQQYENELQTFIADTLFNNYDYDYFLQYYQSNPNLDINKYLPCNSKDHQCSFLCPQYNTCNIGG